MQHLCAEMHVIMCMLNFDKCHDIVQHIIIIIIIIAIIIYLISRMITGMGQTSSLCTTTAEELKQGLPGSNPASGQSGT